MASYGGIKAIHLGPGDNMKIVPVNLSIPIKKISKNQYYSVLVDSAESQA